MIRFKISFAITLFLIIVTQYFYGNQIISSMLLVFFLILIFSLLSLVFLKNYISINLNCLESQKFFIDENIKIFLHVQNKSPFLYPNIKFSSDFFDKKKSLNKNFTLMPFSKFDIELNFKVNTRGLYTSTNCFLKINDLFLIAYKRLNIKNEFTLTVYPKDMKLPSNIEKLIDSSINLSTKDKNSYASDNYSYIDKFTEGDNLKNIHWKLSAKKNNLYVKKFDSIKKSDVYIYMDMTDCSLLSDAFHNITDETLVSFSLSILKYLLFMHKNIYLSIENLKRIVFKLENSNDYNSLLSYYLKHKSLGKGDFFNNILEKELTINENYKTIFIITYTISPKNIVTLSKISVNCELLIIFTLIDVPYTIKNLLSNTNIKVVSILSGR